MNSEIKAKWLEALRSGKYKQGKVHLRDRNSNYCCLGVLCDLISPEDWVENPAHSSAFAIPETKGSRWLRTCFPPNRVLNVAAVTITQGDMLACMNDGGSSFEEIAKYIEEYL